MAATSTLPIDSNGNIGIGTSVPRAALAVGIGSSDLMPAGANNVYIAGHLEVDGMVYGNGLNLTNIEGATGWTKNGQNVYSSGTGNVGIGSALPAQKFDLVGAIRLQNTTSATTGVIYKGTEPFIHNFQHPDGGSQVPVGRNTFVGVGSGNFTMGSTASSVDHASYNTAIGWGTLPNNTTGSNNTAMGYRALYANTTGSHNTAMGSQALVSNTTGSNNTATGANALFSNVNGNDNVAEGANALRYSAGGSNNTVIGADAGGVGVGTTASADVQNTVAVGYRAGYMLGTGDNNILIGYQAGDNITTGDNNIVLGYDIETPSASSSNTLTIGNLIFGTGLDGTGTTPSTGNIGIGTNAPAARLAVVGTSSTTGRAFDVYNTNNSPNFIVLNTGNVGIGTLVPTGAVEVQRRSGVAPFMVSSPGTDGDQVIVNVNGNVGIGTASPQMNLVVNGSAIFKGTASSGIEGELVYDDTADYYEYYDGTQWLELGGGAINYSGSYWTQTGSDIYYNTGNVGIGTMFAGNQLLLVQMADSEGIKINGFDDRSGNYAEMHITSIGDVRFRSNTGMVFDIGGTNFTANTTNLTHYKRKLLADNIAFTAGITGYYSFGYNSADDTFRLAYGSSLTSSSRFSVNAAGNVGIGTSVPVGLLDVSRRLVVLSDGNVGVGTSAPLVALHAGAGAPSLALTTPLGVNDALVKGRLEIDSGLFVNGNLGIGTTDPTQRLSINGGTALENSTLMYMFGDASSGILWPEGNDLGFVAGGTERLRMNWAGNVGVGTTVPVARFHVGAGAPSMSSATPLGSSDTLIKGRLEVDGGLFVTGNSGIGTTAPSTIVQMTYLGNSITTVSDGVTLHNASSTPGALAGVRFSTYSQPTGGNYPKQFVGVVADAAGSGTGDIVFLNRNATDDSVVTVSDEKMRITRYGNVGIGTTAPVALLQVGGGAVPDAMPITGADAYIRGNLEFDGKIYGDGLTLPGLVLSQWTTSGSNIYYTTGNVGIGTTAPLAAVALGAGVPNGGAASYGLYVANTAEFRSSINFDGPAYFNHNDIQIHDYLYFSSETNDLKYASDLNTVFTEYGYRHRNHDHPSSANPFVYVHSATDPDVSNNQWGGFTHDTNNFVFSTGVNVGTGTGPTTTENAVIFSPRGTEAVRISGAGNVGVGTTQPSAALDVVGSFEIPHVTAPSLTSDGQIALETDADSLNIQAGSGIAGGVPVNTDVALPLIQQKVMMFAEPDQLALVTDKVPWFTVDAYNFPNGITVTAVRVATSASSSDTYTIEEWTDPLTYSKDIVAVALAAATEATATTITSASVSAGSYVFIDLDDAQDNINWCKLTVWFYVND